MKRNPKYVGLDVHQATTLAAVREQTGQVIARAHLPTDQHALVEFFRGISGRCGSPCSWPQCRRRGGFAPGGSSGRAPALAVVTPARAPSTNCARNSPA